MKTRFITLFFLIYSVSSFSQNSLDIRLLQNIKSNNFDSVQLLVEQGANVNYCDSNQAPIVMWAALKGDLEMVKYLVEKGADVKRKGIIEDDTYGDFVFGSISGIAIARKELPFVKYLVDNCKIDINDKEIDPTTFKETGWDLLHYAVYVNDTSIITYLLNNDVKIDQFTTENLFPLLYRSVPENLLLHIVKKIRINNDRLIEKDNNGKTLLMEAILCKYSNLGSYFIEKIRSKNVLDVRDNEGRTALFYAVSIYNESLIQRIIDKKADINIKDNYGRNALFLALSKGNIRTIKLLKKAGININLADKDGMTPLMYSIQKRNDSSIINFLLNQAVNPDAKDNNARTALFYAIDNNDISTIKSLIHHGASINSPDNEGYYPLYYSIFKLKPDVSEILLKNGALTEHPDNSNESFCQLAKRRGYKSILTSYSKCYDTLKITYPQRPHLQIPKSHSSYISSMRISQDGKYYATSSGDQTISIREIKSGKEIRNIAPGFFSGNISFSKDNNFLLFGWHFDPITLWDIQLNKEVLKIPYFNLFINSASLSQDNKSALICGSAPESNILFSKVKGITDLDSTLNRTLLKNKSLIGIWNFEQNRLTKHFIYDGLINDAKFSEKNNCIYVCTKGGELINWDLETDEKKILFHDSTITFRNIFFSPNANSILTTTCLKTTWYPLDLLIHNLPNGEVIHKIPNILAGEAKPAFGKDKNEIIYMALEDTGNEKHYSLRKVLIDNGEVINLMNLPLDKVRQCYIYPKKSLLYTSTRDKSEIITYNFKNKNIIKKFNAHLPPITSLDISNDHNSIGIITKKSMIIFPLNGSNLKVYPITDTVAILSSDIDLSSNSILAFGADSVLINYRIDKDSIRQIFSYKAEEELVLFKKYPSQSNIILSMKKPLPKFSNDTEGLGIRLAYIHDISAISMKDKKRNIIIEDLQVDIVFTDGSVNMAADEVQVLTLSSEDNTMLVAGGSSRIQFIDDISGKFISQTFLYQVDKEKERIIKTFNGHQEAVTTAIFLSENKEILSGDRSGLVILWDIEKKSPLLKIRASDIWNGIYSLSLIPFTKYALCGMENGDIILLDLQNGKVLKTLTGHTDKVVKITTDSLGKYGYTHSEDQTIKIWDIDKQVELATLIILDDTEWVISTPNGLFDASPGAMDKLYYVAGMETIDLEQLKHRYYQPGLLPILLGYSDEKLREVPPFDYVRLFPETELSIVNSQLSIDLTNQGGGIGKVSVFIDNIEIIKDARPGGNADSARYEMTIPLNLDDYARYYLYDTTNVIKVVAWNAEGYLSSTPDTIHYIPSSRIAKGVEAISSVKSYSKPHLYGLIVGTSDYAGSLIDLQYAAKDATAFYEALTLGANRLFGEENVSLSLLSTEIPGQEPTLDNIFRQLMDMRKARPDDIVVIYFSGHGVNYGGQDGEFYYLTMTADGADAAYLNDPMVRKYRTISSQDLAFELNQIPARKKVLILDACSSGQAANNLLASLKDIPSSQKRALEFTQDATGSHILASSAPNTVSYETNIYRQGLLTYALLKGMRGGQLKKIEEGEFIDVEQLLQYAKAEVPGLAKSVSGIQEPIYRNTFGTSFIIGQMMEEDKEKIHLAEPLPVFIPCKFTNQDLEQEDINLEDALNIRLDQLSAKGSDARFQFIQNTNYPDAYQITGNYSRKGKKVEVIYILKKGNLKFGGLQKESGDPNNLSHLAEEIIKTIKETISDN